MKLLGKTWEMKVHSAVQKCLTKIWVWCSTHRQCLMCVWRRWVAEVEEHDAAGHDSNFQPAKVTDNWKMWEKVKWGRLK